MKKLLFIFLLYPALLHAQKHRYTRAEIKHAADSVLKSFVGAAIFDHSISQLDDEALICYRYINHKGKERYAEVPKEGDHTKGEFKDIVVRYRVKYPYPKCAVCDTLRARTSLTLDHRLRMKLSPDISFIPDYVWEGDSCRATVRHFALKENPGEGRYTR